PAEQRKHQHDAGEAELLGDHCEDEIGVRLGQVEKFLHGAAEPDAKPFAAADRNTRVRQLETLLERIGPWIEERSQALDAIVLAESRPRDRRNRERAEQREVR